MVEGKDRCNIFSIDQRNKRGISEVHGRVMVLPHQLAACHEQAGGEIIHVKSPAGDEFPQFVLNIP